jgi:protease I
MSLENNSLLRAMLIIAHQGFQDQEYNQVKNTLEEKGIKTMVASSLKGEAQGKLGERVIINKTLDEIKLNDFDALIFIGGPGALEYVADLTAHGLIKETVKQNKVLGAICIAPTILAQAQILKDKKATVWSSEMDQSPVIFLKDKGAKYIDKNVVKDGKIITANGPSAAIEFGQIIAEILKKQ